MTIGDILKEAREKRGLSIRDVQEKTKIRSKYIKALEEEQFGLIPGETYIKVFLKGYARFLGLNGEYLVKEYTRVNRDEIEDESEKPVENKETSPLIKKGNKVFMIFLLIVILMILIFGVYMLFFSGDNNSQSSGINSLITSEDGGKTENSTPEDEQAEIADTADSDYAEKDDNTGPVSEEDSGNINGEYTESFFPLTEGEKIEEKIINPVPEGEKIINPVPEIEDQPDTSLDIPAISAVEKATDLVEENIEEDNRVPVEDSEKVIDDKVIGENRRPFDRTGEAAKKISLIITARSWLRIKVDGRLVFEGIMERGESREFSGKEGLWLRIGNAGGVKVRKGENILGPWGKNGEVVNKRLSFKKDG